MGKRGVHRAAFTAQVVCGKKPVYLCCGNDMAKIIVKIMVKIIVNHAIA